MCATKTVVTCGKVLAHQAAIGIVQHLTMVDAQHAQRCGELLSPQTGELVVVAGIAPMRSRTAFREADHAGFHATLVSQHQGAAKSSTLIIRVGCETHQSKRQVGSVPGKAIFGYRAKASAMQWGRPVR